MPEAFADLIEELSALPPRAREAVLAQLSAAERNTLEALRERSVIQAEDATTLSPWLTACLQEARGGAGAMTSAVRQALVRAADAALGPTAGTAGAADPVGRSLVGAMGGLLAPRRKRL